MDQLLYKSDPVCLKSWRTGMVPADIVKLCFPQNVLNFYKKES